MKLAIFGATGNVGQSLVQQALAGGHEVRALVRAASASRLTPHDKLTVITGALDDLEALERCITGADAVISTLGPRKNTADQVELFGGALSRITSVMKKTGVRRLVAISGAGTLLPGDAPSVVRSIVRGIMLVVARHLLASKAREAEVIRATDLDWVIVRPPRIIAGGPTGKVAADDKLAPANQVTRGDVAAFMLEAASGDRWVGKAPFIAST